LAFGTGVLEAAWTAAADATNDAAAGAHNRATIPTLRAAAPTLVLKVLVMGPLLAPPRRHIRHIRKRLSMALQGIFHGDVAKKLQRHADVRRSFIGVKSLSGKRWQQELGGWLSWKNDADH
jgi:hypothetical protein